MALETLRGVEELDGFDVVIMDELKEKYPEKFNESGSMNYEWFEKEIRPNKFVYVRHDKNSIAFTLQNGPVNKHGVNGCQVTTMIAAARKIIAELNAKFPCEENESTLRHLSQALRWQSKRTSDRKARGVEGHNLR